MNYVLKESAICKLINQSRPLLTHRLLKHISVGIFEIVAFYFNTTVNCNVFRAVTHIYTQNM